MEKKRYEMPVIKVVKLKNSGRLLYAASEVQVKDVDSDEVTGIRSIDNSESEDAYYDLRGVRVQKPHKGLYINNGKKTVVK